MKTTFSIIAAFGMALSCFATGLTGPNTAQTGTSYFTNSASLITNTITFEPGYTYTPAVSVFLTSANTNALPLVTSVTVSNFNLSINAATNATIVWSAQPVCSQIQWGTQAVLAATPTNISFAVPFVYTPVVTLGSSLTNATTGVSAITTTGFTATVFANATVQWTAVGYTANRAMTGPNGDQGTVTH